jgi:fructuronate reductase
LDGADVDRFVELVAAPTTAIVTLTITESGYGLDGDGHLDPDADPANGALGRLVRGLAARRDRAHADADVAPGAGAIAVVPCDNIPDNGAWLATGVRELAADMVPGLETWIDDAVSFVSTSVDRITPRTTPDDLATAARLTGFTDASPVVTEPFRDWVLSGAFPAGRPAWEHAGARFVDDIEPFERRKLWLLNGSHTLLACLGQLRGHTTVAEAMSDDTCRSAVEAFWDEACADLEAAYPDADLQLDDYRQALRDRFGNARIEHRLEQIAGESTTKLRVRAVPVWRAERDAGRSGAAALAVVAAWVGLVLRDGVLPDARSREVEAALALQEADRIAALVAIVDPSLAAADVVEAIRASSPVAAR